jgi:hypothetical protein
MALLRDVSFETRLHIRSSGRLNSRVAVAVEWTDGEQSLRAEGYTVDIGARLPCRSAAGVRSGTEAAARQSDEPDFLRSRVGVERPRRPDRLGTRAGVAGALS